MLVGVLPHAPGHLRQKINLEDMIGPFRTLRLFKVVKNSKSCPSPIPFVNSSAHIGLLHYFMLGLYQWYQLDNPSQAYAKGLGQQSLLSAAYLKEHMLRTRLLTSLPTRECEANFELGLIMKAVQYVQENVPLPMSVVPAYPSLVLS